MVRRTEYSDERLSKEKYRFKVPMSDDGAQFEVFGGLFDGVSV
jgi:hypothetical protein